MRLVKMMSPITVKQILKMKYPGTQQQLDHGRGEGEDDGADVPARDPSPVPAPPTRLLPPGPPLLPPSLPGAAGQVQRYPGQSPGTLQPSLPCCRLENILSLLISSAFFPQLLPLLPSLSRALIPDQRPPVLSVHHPQAETLPVPQQLPRGLQDEDPQPWDLSSSSVPLASLPSAEIGSLSTLSVSVFMSRCLFRNGCES